MSALNQKSSNVSYGSCDNFDEEEKSKRTKLLESVRSQRSCRITVAEGEDVGTWIRADLENIFARASEGMPRYDELGKVEGIAKKLNSNIQTGIDSSSVERRAEMFGKNELPEDKPITFWQIYIAAWSDRMILLLTAAAVVSLILGMTVPEPGETEVNHKTGWIEGAAILISVLLVTTVSSVNDYRKELKFRKLTEENSAQPIVVIRDGREQTIDVTEIVVGDLVSLGPGLVVPVDGFYVRGMSVVIDESSVTGENDPKKKNDRTPIILTGTVVNTAEDAFMLACAVGESSFGGKLLMESRRGDGPRPTPLQECLDDLAGLIGRFALGTACGLFVALSLIEGYRLIFLKEPFRIKSFIDYFLLCVAVVVVAVPEGLPLAVTIALAYSQGKMHDDNNQVRRLAACETMGCATQICSDKTGTLTQNLMSVVQGYVGMQRFSVRDPGDIPSPINLGNAPDASREILIEGLSINSSSEKVVVKTTKDGTSVNPYWQWRDDKGNKTDNALLDFVDRLLFKSDECGTETSRPHQKIREKCRERGFAIFPFTSDRKFMSAVVKSQKGGFVHYVKGGSDRILTMCDRYMTSTGAEEPMSDAAREKITVQVRSLANDANRTIGVAYTRIDSSSIPEDEPSAPLVWLALIGIQDPLRPEVQEAVRKCQNAGVTVRMCTGDNLDTAIAISRECGIYNKLRGDLAMTGKEFRSLVYDSYGNDANMEKFWPILQRMSVMARSQPLDKQLLVLMLMTRGEVVAVTGDGTNDAPALRLANVGFVMRSGTDIAVKSADIVLLDDNFRSVQRAVVWGRTVNDNIRKFLQLQLTVNVVAVFLTVIGSLASLGHSSPLSTVQLLWVNLIMDTLAALALATEEPSEECLNRGPNSRKAPLVSRRMWCLIAAVSAYQIVCGLILDMHAFRYFPSGRDGAIEHKTLVFNVFVFGTLFHMFNSRKVYGEKNIFEGFQRSKLFLVIIAICVLFQILAVSFFGDAMQVRRLNIAEWAISIAIAIGAWPVGLISRLIPIKEPVFQLRFDSKDVDDDMREFIAKLSKDVERVNLETPSERGMYLRRAMRARAIALWGRVEAHRVHTLRVVNAFRRAHQDRDMRNDVSKQLYWNMKSLHDVKS